MNNDIKTWNTGAHYTSHGQRIAAVAVEGGIVFLDIDRNIDGFIPLARASRAHDLREQVQHNYDFGNYTSAWEHAETLGKLAAAIWEQK